MNRDRILLTLLGASLSLATLACTSSHSGTGGLQPSAAPNTSAIQITQIVATKPDDTQPVSLNEIDISKLDPNDEHAFDSLFQ